MSLLQHSMFQSVFFPNEDDEASGRQHELLLQKVLRYRAPTNRLIRDCRLVVFDFETTGLDSYKDRIIEIGGLVVENGKAVDEFSTLIKPDIPLPTTASKITGITEEMLADQPSIEDELPKFLKFIEGSILVAHNAEFDMAFLRNTCERLGYQIQWPSFCTLKLARALLPDLESKNLDTLAQHYQLSFEARHRSIGDCKVTSAVLQSFLSSEGSHLEYWNDFEPYAVGQNI
ncbi:3'-5' exonuclease [Pseudobacteriovorax antillogorgiicola]|uniref:DNA polymerase-3 subunit epsilon n=1 Tax=Pseudobacteriovorax antillogorgiicola TaxID=1513793 RepID=A0A1Y6BA52_9BACT|nr:3'-5' exonuclease [Pseudobacteriovorax antillogorgiicola]TCS58580.1 DNA polymerase-3 subunit epsilon [Pseudobacteriovorax antillogorgiicola]SME97273.1 DNA polymerase-3 subunit epsilon [Pseudobacteriovorax antillogorgiicola]